MERATVRSFRSDTNYPFELNIYEELQKKNPTPTHQPPPTIPDYPPDINTPRLFVHPFDKFERKSQQNPCTQCQNRTELKRLLKRGVYASEGGGGRGIYKYV